MLRLTLSANGLLRSKNSKRKRTKESVKELRQRKPIVSKRKI